ncbi:M1 family metallopeptidase [Labrenzia sp. VG12]|uniref:M1 family metallopeptidase n=1 Tax=Labrenzia sp. VG12 TaxID=2021862 RepID=UPI000B8BD286|nr:M1 family aminopeptidase [Labrenzia sp. VG12]ASP34564.1 peptidase M1 [Labrenzia sp. VG12]
MFRAAFLVLILGVLSLSPADASGPAAPTHHALVVQLDPATRSLKVTDEITVEGRTRLFLRFADWMVLEEISLNGKPIDGVTRADGVVVPLANADAQTVTIRLRGEVPGLEQGSRNLPDAFAGPEGAFLSGYAGWFPYVGDKVISYRLDISVPAPFRAVSFGSLREETSSENGNTAIFEQALSLEPPSLFVGPYEVGESHVGSTRLRTYFPERLADYSDQYLDTAGKYLADFGTEIGAYPFEDFHIISSPLPVGLGYPNLTYIGEMIVPLPFMQGQSLAHEILHNWWGNGVQVDYGSGNWAEGLTTYMADYGLAREKGADAARQMRLGWLRDYAALPTKRDQAVNRFISKRHQAAQVIGYNKTAHIFHMLEGEIGASAFSEGIRRFWTEHQFKIAGWSDLQNAFEATSGRDLAWFFDQWISQPGAPSIAVADVTTAREDDTYLTSLTVKQSEPTYRLRLPVDLETTAGVARHHAEIDGPSTTLRFETNDQPTRISLDPDFDLFRHLLPGESPPILRDVTLAAAVDVVVLDSILSADAAMSVVPRMVDRGAKLRLAKNYQANDRPALVFGTRESLERFAATHGLERLPAPNTEAAAWVDKTPSGAPVLLISVNSPEGLQAVSRTLRHYGRQSFVTFADGRAVDRGIWPSGESPLTFPLAGTGSSDSPQ